MTHKMENYLVLWCPPGLDNTVDKIKAIDAWASDGGMRHNRAEMVSKLGQYTRQHGTGYVWIVKGTRKVLG